MNIDQAVRTITKRAFTVRQALFLILVARHSGVCVMRQYSTFAGIVFGQKTRMFFAKLVRLGFVSTYDCAHGRGHVYALGPRDRARPELHGDDDAGADVGALCALAEGGPGGREPAGPDPRRSKRRGRKCRANVGTSWRPSMTARSHLVGFTRGWPQSYS